MLVIRKILQNVLNEWSLISFQTNIFGSIRANNSDQKLGSCQKAGYWDAPLTLRNLAKATQLLILKKHRLFKAFRRKFQTL